MKNYNHIPLNKRLALLFTITHIISIAAALAQQGTLDLTNLQDYAGQTKPDYITKDNTPAGNPITNIGATLGRVLFHDKRLSKNNTISCASCHQQQHAFSDPNLASIGVNGSTGRHSMRLINAKFSNETRFFWDERAVTLEDQTTQPIKDHIEMGFSGTNGDQNFTDLITKLSAITEYKVLFTGVFGDPAITEERVQRSISQFIRSIQSFDSKYDLGRATTNNDGAPFPNFTPAENAGKQLFLAPPPANGAGCAGCHQPPEFDIAPNSRNNGVITSLDGTTDTTNTRSPSLRDLVDKTGTPHTAFMHDGSLPTLASVINHYNAIPAVVPNLDPRLSPGGQPQRLNLNQTQKDNLIAFLKTLTGTSVYTDEKWSNPFTANDEINIIILPSDKTSITFTSNGASRTANITSPAAPNIEYIFQTSSDLQNWTSETVTSTPSGTLNAIDTTPETETKKFYRFIYKPTP